jgi:hypothetical protein
LDWSSIIHFFEYHKCS